MQYFFSFQYWFYQTDLYQNILSEMPAPFNNIYFDTVFLLGLVVYVIYRIIEMIRISCYHKRVRRKQANERQIRLERDQEMRFRERQVQEKEERIGRFMDYMDLIFRNHIRKDDSTEQTGTVEARKKLGFRGFFLEKKGKKDNEDIVPETYTSDYDVIMENYVYDEQWEKEISRIRERESEEVFSKIHTLDDELRVDVVSDSIESATTDDLDPDIEKRKARARKLEEKERKKAERISKKKRGFRHG